MSSLASYAAVQTISVIVVRKSANSPDELMLIQVEASDVNTSRPVEMIFLYDCY